MVQSLSTMRQGSSHDKKTWSTERQLPHTDTRAGKRTAESNTRQMPESIEAGICIVDALCSSATYQTALVD
jgi:hypothetical protein